MGVEGISYIDESIPDLMSELLADTCLSSIYWNFVILILNSDAFLVVRETDVAFLPITYYTLIMFELRSEDNFSKNVCIRLGAIIFFNITYARFFMENFE